MADEVSTKIVDVFVRGAQVAGIDVEALFDGLVVRPKPSSQYFDWDEFCELCRRLLRHSSPARLVELGTTVLDVKAMGRAWAIVSWMATPRTLYWASQRWGGRAMFRHLEAVTYAALPDGRLNLTVEIPSHYQDCDAFFYLNQGVNQALPRLLGLEDADVQAEIRGRFCSYVVRLPRQASIGRRILRVLRMLFSPRAAVRELAEQHEELQLRFRQLQEAQAETKRALEAAQEAKKTAESARLVAEEALVARMEFTAAINHELRTPLNGILGCVQLLEQTRLSADQRELAETALASGRSLLSLINSVLDLSKLESQGVELESEPLDLRAIVDQVAAIHRRDPKASDLELVATCDPACERGYAGDRLRIEQILHNLVSNAVKFTHHGRIDVSASIADGVIVLEVRDTGVGIPADALRKIFEPYRQVDGSTTRRYGGTGLGLALCERLVALMHGSIAVESAVGIGSRFRVRLPLRAAAPGSEEALPATRVKATAEPHDASRARPASDSDADAVRETPRLAEERTPCLRRALLAEDNPINKLVFEKMARKLGCELVCVPDGASAVAAWEHERFDCVFMDCQMPVMDGLQATTEIRRREGPERSTYIIAVTANATQEDRQRCLEVGMDDFLAKPIELESLRTALGVARRHRTNDTKPRQTAC